MPFLGVVCELVVRKAGPGDDVSADDRLLESGWRS